MLIVKNLLTDKCGDVCEMALFDYTVVSRSRYVVYCIPDCVPTVDAS